MELITTIEKRRSVRKYLPEPVPREVIEKAMRAALLAPNSSNLQPWELYWVTSPEKKALLVTACFDQSSASTAAELVVFIARSNTWRRNRALLLEAMTKSGAATKYILDYYKNLVPLFYVQGWLSLLGLAKKLAFNLVGFFRPVPRGPFSQGEVVTVLSKTVALACQNFMLAITDQGYSSCPMEGCDVHRVKKILGLGASSSVVMVISIGREDPAGIYGPRLRLDPSLFLYEV